MDESAKGAFRLLLRRAELKTLWAAGEAASTPEELEERIYLITGSKLPSKRPGEPDTGVATPREVAAMSHEQRMDFMDAQIRAAGLDPANIQWPTIKS